MNIQPLHLDYITTKYYQGPANIIFGRYGNDEIAMLVLADDLSRVATATVALDMAPNARNRYTPHVWLKGWAENEGLPQALELAGVVKLTSETFRAGFVEAVLGELTPEALRVYEAFNKAVKTHEAK